MSNLSRTPFKLVCPLLVLAGLCLGELRSHGQPSSTFDPKFWTPDGTVSAILVTNDTIYLGGDFFYLGPRTGPAGLFDQATGQLLAAPPRINGVVSAVVSDGSGGWFIGGTFTSVGGVTITNLAHLLPDLSLDARWNARITGTTINSLLLDGARLYVGGQYTRIGGQTRGNLAAVNASDAGLVTAWDPQPGGSVNAMRVAGNLLYVGGNFFSVGSSNNANLAAISTTTALATGWRPDPGAQLFTLEVSGNIIYIGGADFGSVGTRSRHYLAAVDATTGIGTTWDPNPNGAVRAIAVVGSTLYVGGDFTTIAIASRRGFAAVPVAGLGRPASSLDLQLQSAGTAKLVRSLLVQSNSLYVGGSFSNALGAQHPLIVGIDISTSQPVPVPLGSEFNGSAGAVFGASALAGANGTVLVGGEFQSIGGVARQRAGALSLSTGSALPWAPAFDASVLSLAFGSNRVYVGGAFTNLNSTNLVRGLAAVDPTSGDPALAFTFLGSNQFSGVRVSALAVGSNVVYAGGDFTFFGNLQRRLVAALNPVSGLLITNFDAKLGGGGFSGGVTALAVSRTNLYVGGDFTTVNAVSFPRLAAVSGIDGSPLNWPVAPSPNQAVTALAATADNLYVGGQFATIGGITLRNFAAFSLADRSLLPVDASLPNFAQGVNAIGATPTALYVGGTFDSIGGEFRLNLGCLAFFASAYEWDPAPDQPPTVITLTDGAAFIGGPYRSLGRSPTNQVGGFFSVFPRAPRISRVTLSTTNSIIISTTTGDRTDAVLQATPDLESPLWVNIATNDIPGYSWTFAVPVTPGNRFFRTVAR